MKIPATLINHHTVLSVCKFSLFLMTLALAMWIVGCKAKVSGEFFVQKGCVECHSVSVFGLKSQNNTGPDLALAVEDAPKRFGKSLDMFWMNPTGTMQMVLSSKITLTPDEKNQALDLLKAAYELKKEEMAKAQK